MVDRTRRQDAELPRKRLAALAEELRGRSGADARDGPTVVFASAEDADENGTRSAPPAGAKWARRHVGRLVERWIPGGRRPRPAVLALVSAGALAAVAVLVGVWWQRPPVERPPDLPVKAAVGRSTSPVAQSGALLVVDVIGEVPKPGLVTVTSGARIADAVQAAGGLNPGAQLQGLNLARRVADGEQIAVGVPTPTAPAAAGGAVSPEEKLDLNTATEDQLDSLPGVGPVTAQRIIDRRTKQGPFTSVEQLREVEGIGDSRLAKLSELVRV
jgi:competence protein ComEA